MSSDPVSVRHTVARQRRLLVLAVTVAVPAIIFAFGWILNSQFDATERLDLEVERSHERRRLALAVLSANQDMETASRGYVITGQPEYLEPFDFGRRNADQALARLAKLTGDESQKAAALTQVATYSALKAEMTAKTIEEFNVEGREAAVARVASGKGKVAMDAVRASVASFNAFEAKRLRDVTDGARAASDKLRALAFALLGLLMVLLGASFFFINRTLKARQHALDRLSDSSQRREAVLASAMDAIFTINPSGTVETVNRSAQAMFGYSPDDLLRRDIGMLFAEKREIGDVARNLAAMDLRTDGSGRLQEIVARRRDGSTFPTDVALTKMELADGIHYVAVVRDISERKRIDRMKAEFVSTVSHELRTPLTSISGALGLLAAGSAGPLADKPARLISIARKNAERLIRLINDILDIERIESGRMRFENREVALFELAEDVIQANRPYADEHDVALKLHGDVEARVNVDPDRMVQILTNLVSNAIKFSPPKGTVQIEIEPGEVNHRISVIDHGKGIPEEFRSRIFGKFAQADASDSREKGGTGLGLSIVRELVTVLGGKVWYESVPDVRTAFHVDLPAVGDEAAAAKRRQRRILLFGAEGAVEEGLLQQLAANGFRIDHATTAAELGRLIGVNAHNAVVFVLAEGDDEIALVSEVRSSPSYADVPIIAVRDAGQLAARLEETVLVFDYKERPPAAEDIKLAIAMGFPADRPLPRILHVDDDPDILSLVQAAFQGKAMVLSAANLADARTLLANNEVDIAILDLGLDGEKGSQLLPELGARQDGPVPTIIFSAEHCDEEATRIAAASLLKTGAPLDRLVEAVQVIAERRRFTRRDAA